MNEVACYDFRYNASTFENPDLLRKILTGIAKRYVFQLETGDSGYEHYQGRLTLIKKRRKNVALKLFSEGYAPNYFEPTCNPEFVRGDAFYQMKEDTRTDGPWTDKDEAPPYIPRQIREIVKLYPWQQTIVEHSSDWDTRKINVVYCPEGNQGKSILCGYCRAHRTARVLPPVNDHKDMMRMVCDLPTARCYLIDMPRSFNKERLYGFFSAIETLKDGYAYDDRYSFKEKVFDCPNIWIFTNSIPNVGMLSADRWLIWCIKNHELKRYVAFEL